jgi:sugar phosphate isomerase/epimerase
MITQAGLDTVLIATPPATHYEIAKACMQRKVNVIMEKPAVLDLDKYDDLLKTAKENGVKICLENMFVSYKDHVIGAICSDTYEAVAYIDELNEIAGEDIFCFCLDTGHINLLSKNIYNAILELGDCIETLHVHDNYGVKDSHDVPFAGNTDWEAFIKGIKEIGYKGNMNFEIASGAINKYPEELRNDALRLLSATGRHFVKEIEK